MICEGQIGDWFGPLIVALGKEESLWMQAILNFKLLAASRCMWKLCNFEGEGTLRLALLNSVFVCVYILNFLRLSHQDQVLSGVEGVYIQTSTHKLETHYKTIQITITN